MIKRKKQHFLTYIGRLEQFLLTYCRKRSYTTKCISSAKKFLRIFHPPQNEEDVDEEDDDRSSCSPVKSIFEFGRPAAASRRDILHYLEDARERGFTDAEVDEDVLDEDGEEILVTVVGGEVAGSTTSRRSKMEGSERQYAKRYNWEKDASNV